MKTPRLLLLFQIIFIILATLPYVEPKRSGSRGGSRSSGSSRKSSWNPFRSKSKSKPKPAPVYPKQPSYPKQSGVNYGSKTGGTGGIPPAGSNGFGSNSNFGNKGGSSFGNKNSMKTLAGVGAGSYMMKNGYKKSSNFNKFAAGGALGGATFGKTMGKTKYLGMSSKTLKKGAIAVGATYVGYKLAKGAGKALGKAYFYGMYRPSIYHGRSWYFDNDDYYYRGELNDRCDIWYSVEMRQEIMRCDQGYYYNYDRENPNSSNYDPNYNSWNSQPSDWNRNAEFKAISDEFDRDDQNIDYNAMGYNKYGRSGYDADDMMEDAVELGIGIAKFILGTIIICCLCACGCGYYCFKKSKGSSSSGIDHGRSAESDQHQNFEAQPMNVPMAGGVPAVGQTPNAPGYGAPVQTMGMPPQPGYSQTNYQQGAPAPIIPGGAPPPYAVPPSSAPPAESGGIYPNL